MAHTAPNIVKILCTTQVHPDHFHAGRILLNRKLSSPQTHADRIDPPLDARSHEITLTDRPLPLQVVECDDGLLRMYFDGRPLGERAWPISELDDCISCFLATSHSLRLGESIEATLPQCSEQRSDQSAERPFAHYS